MVILNVIMPPKNNKKTVLSKVMTRSRAESLSAETLSRDRMGSLYDEVETDKSIPDSPLRERFRLGSDMIDFNETPLGGGQGTRLMARSEYDKNTPILID